MIMRRKLFYGKGSSLMTRKFDYEKEVVSWKRSSMMRRQFDYEKEVVSWKRKFYDDKKVVF